MCIKMQNFDDLHSAMGTMREACETESAEAHNP